MGIILAIDTVSRNRLNTIENHENCRSFSKIGSRVLGVPPGGYSKIKKTFLTITLFTFHLYSEANEKYIISLKTNWNTVFLNEMSLIRSGSHKCPSV